MNWGNCYSEREFLRSQTLALEYFFFKNIIPRRPSVQYRNRFLANTYYFISKLSNFFVYKGLKLKYLKIFNYSAVAFIYKLQNTRMPGFFFKKYQHSTFPEDFDNYHLMTRLIDNFSFFSDFNILIPSLLQQATPMVKPLILKRNFFKKKKIPNRLKTKFNIKYIYIPENQRLFTVMRWFGMLVKFSSKPLVERFIEVSLNSSLEDQSLLIKLRNYVYERLAAEHD